VNEPTVWQAAVLGLLQGLSEFLPTSSSAHLSLTPWVFNWPAPGLAFDVALHVGTLAAVLWYFRREWIDLARAGARIVTGRGDFAATDERRAVLIVVGTIPAAVGGLLLNDYAETVFRTPALTASALIVMGLLLWMVDRHARSDRALTSFTVRDALLVGMAQVAALVPGVSRSGATITAGRALGADRGSAAVFSFLLSMPITAAAAMLKVPEAIAESGSLAPLITGVVCAALSGWLAIGGLLRFLRLRGYAVFAFYRFALGAAIFALIVARG
jgi:undecaprenyl-diphosphatase